MNRDVEHPASLASRNTQPPGRPADRGNWGVLLGAAGWFVVLAFLANAPYCQAPLAYDDFVHLAAIGDVARGAMPLVQWIHEPHNLHWMPLWKGMFFFHWCLGGPNWVWHAELILLHAVLGWQIFLLLRTYALSNLAPWIAASVWSASSLSAMDTPCGWISSTHLPFALAWLFGAFLIVAHAARLGRIAAPILVFAFLMLTCLTMGSLIVLFPFVGLAAYFHGFSMEPPHRPPRGPICIAVLMAISLGGITQWFAIRPYLPQVQHGLVAAEAFPTDRLGLLDSELRFRSASVDPAVTSKRVPASIGNIAWGTLVCFGSGFDQLFNIARPPVAMDFDPRPGVVLRLGLAAAVACLLLRRRSRLLPVAGMVLAGTVAYTVMVVLGRVELGLVYFWAWGRYGYVAALFWCVLLATTLDAVLGRSSSRAQKQITVLSTFLLVAFALQGRSLAAKQIELRWQVDGGANERVILTDVFVAKVGEAVTGQQLVLPNFAVIDHETIAFPGGPLSLAAYLAYRRPKNSDAIRAVDAREWTREHEARALQVLTKVDHPVGAAWIQGTRDARELVDGLLALEALGVREGTAVRLPHRKVRLGAQSLFVCDAIWLLFPGGVSGVVFVDPADLTLAEYDRLEAKTSELSSSEFWRAWLRQGRQDLDRDAGELDPHEPVRVDPSTGSRLGIQVE